MPDLPTTPLPSIQKTWKNALIGTTIITGFLGCLVLFWLFSVQKLEQVVGGAVLALIGPSLLLLYGAVLFLLWVIPSRFFPKKLGWNSPGTALMISSSICFNITALLITAPLFVSELVVPACFFILLIAFYFLYYPVKRFQWLLNIGLFIAINQIWGTFVVSILLNQVINREYNSLTKFPVPLYFSETNSPRSILVSDLLIEQGVKQIKISNEFSKLGGNFEIYESPVNTLHPPEACHILGDVYNEVRPYNRDSCEKIGEVKTGQPIYTNSTKELYTIFDGTTLVVFRRPNYPVKKDPSLSEQVEFMKTFHRVSTKEFSNILQENRKINPPRSF